MLEQDTTSEGESTGDDLALDFGGFFHDEYRRLFHALVLICGDRGEADDVAQESFVKIFERWDRVSEMAAPTAYLFKVALNEHLSRSRRALRWSRRTLFVRGNDDDASEAAIARAEVGRAVGNLTLEQRVAVVLVDFVGMDSEEAGAALGIDGQAVRARLHRARTVLREELKDHD